MLNIRFSSGNWLFSDGTILTEGGIMAVIPSSVSEAWENRKGPAVLTTVDDTGKPNAIYVTCIRKVGDDSIVIADNYFDKTRKNILADSKVSVLFITDKNKSFQIKGAIEYHKSGDVFEDMKTWNPKQHPGHAAALVKVEEIYSGAERLA
jgi:predicted pyridoxine 5'-phosphate oxidase superfamily flavin-nucleotide-binding protein